MAPQQPSPFGIQPRPSLQERYDESIRQRAEENALEEQPSTQRYRVTVPDGRSITIRGPAGAPQEDILRIAQEQLGIAPTETGPDPAAQVRDPGREGGTFARTLGQGVRGLTTGAEGLLNIISAINPTTQQYDVMQKMGLLSQEQTDLLRGKAAFADPALEQVGKVLPSATREAETTGEQVAAGVGGAIAALPLGLAGRAIAPASRFFAPYARPLRAGIQEATVGAGAGAAYGVAKERYPDSPAAQLAAALAAGVGTGAAVGAGTPALLSKAKSILGSIGSTVKGAAGKGGPLRETGRIGMDYLRERTYGPMTETGAKARAAGELRRRVPDPDAIARELADPLEGFPGEGAVGPYAKMTPAQRIGDPEVLDIERSVAIRGGPRARLERDIQLEQAEAAIKGQIAGIADPEELTILQNAAVARANAQIARLTPAKAEVEDAIILKKTIGKNAKVAVDRETEVWNFPKTDKATPVKYLEELSALKTGTSGYDPEFIPSYVDGYVKPPAPPKPIQAGFMAEQAVAPPEEIIEIPLQKMHHLYSRLRETSRNATAGDDPSKGLAAVTKRLADAVWEDLLESSQGPRFEPARAYSRRMNETFRGGAVGRLLGYEATGGEIIDPIEAFAKTISETGGVGAARQVDDLRATGKFIGRETSGEALRETDAVIVDGLKNRFQFDVIDQRVTTRGGSQTDLMREKGEEFLKNYKVVLDRFPEGRKLRREIESALRAQGNLERIQGMDDSIRRAFISNTPVEEIQAMKAQALRGTAKEQQENFQALQSSLVRWLISGGEGQSLNLVLAKLDAPKTKQAIGVVFTPDKIKRLRRFIRNLDIIVRERGVGALPQQPGPLITDAKGKIMEVGAGFAGAKLGRHIGGLKVISTMSRLFEKAFGSAHIGSATEFMTDAINDKSGKMFLDFLEVSKPQSTAPEAKAEAIKALRKLTIEYQKRDPVQVQIAPWILGLLGQQTAAEVRGIMNGNNRPQ